MVSPDQRSRRTFATLSVCTLVIFAALLFGLTAVLRARLRREIRQRDAQAIHDVALMQIAAAEARLNRLGVSVADADIFAAVLESSRLRGVLSVQLFDPDGRLKQSLPAVAPELVTNTWWPRPLTEPVARYYANGRLEQIIGGSPESDAAAERTPLLEVIVPLHQPRSDESLGVARYWVEGSVIAAEYRRLDSSLAAQAGVAFVGGAALIGLLLAWSYRRLQQAQDRLIEQSADLARANQELDFAAKTGALGAISAHLIHGLKNPLAGLEGFVTEAATDPASARGDAQRTALETARRVRTMVNEVVAVLRDEAAGGADYPVPLTEALEAVQARARPLAAAGGITLEVPAPTDVAITARTANLAGLVLANLLTNAIEATPRGGTLRVDTEVGESRVDFVVSDTGPGLAAAVRDALFRPVVSTKPGGGGMGLAISARLARHAGGELSLVRSDARGTVFKLTVPTAKSA